MRAVNEARGNYILWTDDDVIVSTRWLAAHADAFKSWPNAAVFGGHIFPKLKGKPPSWLLCALRDELFAGVYSHRDLGTEPIKLERVGHKIPYGPNFAVHTQVQRQYSYDARLGRRNNNNFRGEETDVILKILDSGAVGRWVPDAPVQDVIPQQFQTIKFLRHYFIAIGRLRAIRKPAPQSQLLFGAPRWLWCEVFASHLSLLVSRAFWPPEIWCLQFRQASVSWGQLKEEKNTKH